MAGKTIQTPMLKQILRLHIQGTPLLRISSVVGASRNSNKSGQGQELMGRTECNRIVNFDGGPQGARLLGQMLDVHITEALPHSLRAVVSGVDATRAPAGLAGLSVAGAPAQSPATTA